MRYLNFTSPIGIRDVNNNHAAREVYFPRNLLERVVRIRHGCRTPGWGGNPRAGGSRRTSRRDASPWFDGCLRRTGGGLCRLQ